MQHPSHISPLLFLALASTFGCRVQAQEPTPTNPGFEQALQGWTVKEKVSMSRVLPDAARSGTGGLRVEDADEKQGSSVTSAPLPLPAGQGARLTFWARTQSKSFCSVYLQFLGASGKQITPSTTPAALINKSGGNWVQYTVESGAPAGATSATIWIHSFGKGTGTVDFDDFTLTVAPLLPVAVRTAETPTAKDAVRTAPPVIMIKVDDLKDLRGRINPRWQRITDYLRGRKIKFGIGIICNSLEGDKPVYFDWIKTLHASDEVEFWNHGYDHKEWEENGVKLQEFKGPSLEQQQDHLLRSQKLAKEKLGFTMPTFGAPFNATDANTLTALEKDPDTKIWLYGNPKTPAGKLVFDRVYPVNIENPTFLPDVEKFKTGYAKYPTRPYFVIQGHPGNWDDARFEQFTKIIDFLVEQKVVFMTPSEYAATLKPAN